MPKKAIDYNRTIIYKLVKNDDFDNENIYVGSTTEFIKRKNCHKTSCCNENSKGYNFKVYENIRQNGGWSEWKMIEIEKYPCKDKREAEAREEYWRCEFNARLNTIRPFTTAEQKKEEKKQYYKEHADKIKEQTKQYYTKNAYKMKQYNTDNADKIKERMKQYHTENADKLRQKYDCDCGSVYTHQSKSIHFKTKKHQNYINNKIEMI